MKTAIVSLLVVIETTLLTVAAYACDPPVLFSKPPVTDHFGTKIEATHRCFSPSWCPICSPKIRIVNDVNENNWMLPHTPPVFVLTRDHVSHMEALPPCIPCRRNLLGI